MSASRAGWIDLAGLTVLACVATGLLIGDFGVRLANTSTDDGLVAIAYFYRHPELFAQDLQMHGWAPAALATMVNWLPAILFKHAGVPPEVFFWLFTFMQNVLLALAMHRLALVMMQDRDVALISAVFTLTFLPHWWNAGLFADLYWMPYGAWMALPFLLYAGAFALERRLGATSVMLLVGGLLHPVLGLFAVAMMGAFWVVVLMREGGLGRVLAPAAALGAVCIVFLVPVVLARVGGEEEAPAAIMLGVVLKNGHAIPWANPSCSYCMPLFVKSLVAGPALAALALMGAWRASAHPRLGLFLVTCVLVTLAACILHALAYLAKNATILRVISTRSTILLLGFAVPPAIALGWRLLSTARSPVTRFLACHVITAPAPIPLVAGLLASVRGDKTPWLARSPARFLALLSVAAGLSLLALTLARSIPPAGAWIDAHVIEQFIDASLVPALFGAPGRRVQIFFVAVSAFLAWQAGRTKGEPRRAGRGAPASALALALMAPLIIYFLAHSYQIGKLSTTGEARDYYEVQAWARSSTPPEATFVVGDTSVYEGWRNFTHRARISTPLCNIYACPKATVGQGADEFFAQHGNAGLAGLDTNGLKAFARTFGGHYAVRRKSWPAVDLPVAYENQAYVVYDLR